jgi:hypothetical protein
VSVTALESETAGEIVEPGNQAGDRSVNLSAGKTCQAFRFLGFEIGIDHKGTRFSEGFQGGIPPGLDSHDLDLIYNSGSASGHQKGPRGPREIPVSVLVTPATLRSAIITL